MTIEPVTPYTEAPASWNVSYITPEGFVCRITLRGENGKDLLDKAGVALAFLMQHGCTPEKRFTQTKQCPIHKCDMRKYEKDGKTWWAHKTDDGAWCNDKKQK